MRAVCGIPGHDSSRVVAGGGAWGRAWGLEWIKCENASFMSWILSNGGRAPGRVWELEAATLLDYRGGRVGEWARGLDRYHLHISL